eukprot:4429216-Prymnesium_polylepis.1
MPSVRDHISCVVPAGALLTVVLDHHARGEEEKVDGEGDEGVDPNGIQYVEDDLVPGPEGLCETQESMSSGHDYMVHTGALPSYARADLRGGDLAPSGGRLLEFAWKEVEE